MSCPLEDLYYPIMQLFRLLKAIPNFTNVVYVLAFNKDVVYKFIAETQGISGDIYLDKIIQTTFELPLPDKILLRRLLFEKLNAIFANTPKQMCDRTRTHWSNLYFQGIDHFINTPRDIVRLTNILTVAYPVVEGEVNPADFVAIESLRVFCPVIYESIHKNPQYFAGCVNTKNTLISTIDELKHFHNSWLAQLEDKDKEPVKRLLFHLFPKIEAVYCDTHYEAKHESVWRQHLRICSLEMFPNYFRLALTTGEFSHTDAKAILSLAADAKAFGEKLVELADQKRPDGTTQVRAFLEQLEDYMETEIPVNCISSIVQALFDVGDQLLVSEDEPYGMFDLGNDMRIGRIISQLLRRLNEQERFETLKYTMSSGNALSIIVSEIITLVEEHEVSPQQEWLLSTQHLKELEEIALQRLQDAVVQNSLQQVPKLAEKLYCWQSEAKEDVKRSLQKIVESGEGLANLMRQFL